MSTSGNAVQTAPPPNNRADKVEDTIKLVILAAIMLAALAASFTHMKEWTMTWLPANTPQWFGWANAIISELVPLAATLSLRKRLRQGKPLMSYALFILLGGAALSLAAQLSAVGADASLSAKFLAALPALAFLFLSKLVMGDLDSGRKHAEIEADRERQLAAERKQQAEMLHASRAETAAAKRKLAETLEALKAETARIVVETKARAQAETAAQEALVRAETEAETRVEISTRAEAEISTHQAAVAEAREAARIAEQRAAEQAQAARMAEGRLAEARDAADRAAAARTLAEQQLAEQLQQVSAVAEQVERALQEQIDVLTEQALAAEARVDELVEHLRITELQRDEAQAFAERQAAARARAEAEIGPIIEARDAAVEEVERLRQRLARQAEVRSRQQAEISTGARPEIGRAAGRKSLAAVPAVFPVELPAELPPVETVAPETVAVVLAARAQNPDATHIQLAELTGFSTKTVSKVVRAVPADVVHRVLELTDGRVA